MVTKSERRKQLAREQYQKYQQRRAAEQAKRRQRLTILGVLATVLLVVGGAIWATIAFNGANAPSTPVAGSSPSTSAAAGQCAYTPSGTASKDVGVPPAEPGDLSGAKTATLTISGKPVVVSLEGAKAPCTTASFAYLASKGYFNGTKCHRLTTSDTLKVLQCGDPAGNGSGGPGYQFKNENTEGAKYTAGTLAMANAGADTNGSQFFLVYGDSTLPPSYTVFGTITSGLDVITAIATAGVSGGGSDGAPAAPATLDTVTVAAR